MKHKLTLIVAALAGAVLASCVGPSPFTAEPDPLTGIRKDTPEGWAGSDPLNTPGTDDRDAANHPLLTWQGRNDFFFGHPSEF